MPQQDRFEERRLNGAYVAMVGALPCRPEPRHLWDNVASGGRVKHPAAMAVIAGKVAIRAAIARGDMKLVDETVQRSDAYFDECKQAARAEYMAIIGGEIPLAAAIARASKETTEALYAIQVSTLGQQTVPEFTDKEIDEAIAALSDLRASRVAKSSPINRRATMALS